MDEILPGIFLIRERGRIKTFMPEVSLYVLAGPGALLFDGGYGGRGPVNGALRELDSIESFCEKEGRPFRLERVLPSHAHPDHVSGLARLRKHRGLKILLSRKTAAIIASRKDYNRTYNEYREPAFAAGRGPAGRLMETVKKGALYLVYNYAYGKSFVPDPDGIVTGGDVLTVNGEEWHVIETPGHASDHVSLYSPARGVLLGGDNVLAHITTWLGPPDSDLSLYRRTLERIAALDPLTLILPAHGPAVTDPRRRIRQILDARRRRTAQVMKLLRARGENGATLAEILKGIYPNPGIVTGDLARGWVILTIEELAASGAVEMLGHRGNVRIREAG